MLNTKTGFQQITKCTQMICTGSYNGKMPEQHLQQLLLIFF